MCMCESLPNYAREAVGNHWITSVEGIDLSFHVHLLPQLNSVSSLSFDSCSGTHPQQAKSFDRWHLGQRNGGFLALLLFNNSFPLPPSCLLSREKELQRTWKRNGRAVAVPRFQLLFSARPLTACFINFKELHKGEAKSWCLLMLSRTCPPKTPLRTWAAQSYLLL